MLKFSSIERWRRNNISNESPGAVLVARLDVHMGVSKNRGTSKWMVFKGKLIGIDDLGVPLFLETPIYVHV